MESRIVLSYGLFVIMVLFVSVNDSSAFPAGPWAEAVDPDLYQLGKENLFNLNVFN